MKRRLRVLTGEFIIECGEFLIETGKIVVDLGAFFLPRYETHPAYRSNVELDPEL